MSVYVNLELLIYTYVLSLCLIKQIANIWSHNDKVKQRRKIDF